MKKFLMIGVMVFLIIAISSFVASDKSKSTVGKTTRINEVMKEINDIIPSDSMIQVTPKLEKLFIEFYQLNYELGKGPNAVDYSMILKYCWECRCSKCNYRYFDTPCKFFHNCDYYCPMCACGGNEGGCLTPWVGECHFCPL